jgi:hypothetical protein
MQKSLNEKKPQSPYKAYEGHENGIKENDQYPLRISEINRADFLTDMAVFLTYHDFELQDGLRENAKWYRQ